MQVSIINAWILYKETYWLAKHDKYGNLLSFLDEIINEWSVMGVVADLEPILASKVQNIHKKIGFLLQIFDIKALIGQ